jgi:hypothetical protein
VSELKFGVDGEGGQGKCGGWRERRIAREMGLFMVARVGR